MATEPFSCSPEQLLAQTGWLHALARRLVADPGTADDLVQDTLVAAIQRPPRTDMPLRPWLAKVARNFARSRARSETQRRARESGHDPEHGAGRDVPSPAELNEKLESQRLLVQALGELAEPYRSTILLHYWEHLSSEEIAARQGVAAGTVRWRLKQGVDRLRERLDARHSGDRRAWVLLLAPLAHHDAQLVGVASTSVFMGILGMNLFLKLSVAAALAVLIGTGLWLIDSPPLGTRPAELVASDEHEPVEFSSWDQGAPAPIEPADSAPERAAIVAAPEVPAAAADDIARVRVRVLDQRMLPLAGARVRASSIKDSVTGTSDANGVVEVALDASTPYKHVNLFVSAFGCASRTLEERSGLQGGALLDLGDVVLDPGGVLAGTVVHRDGKPLAGARVGLDELEVMEEDLRMDYFVPQWREPFVMSDADGRFRLEGVPVGFARLIATEKDHLPRFSGVIEVRERQESGGIDLVLDPVPDDRLLRGIVLDPDGKGIAGQPVSYKAQAGRGSSSSSFYTDAHGRFQTITGKGDRFEFFAEDVHQRWASIRVADVTAERDELVLRFTAARTCELRVTARGGEPVTAFAVRAWTTDHKQKLGEVPHATHADGRAQIPLPAEEFVLEVDAPGHQLGTLGPLVPADVHGALLVELERLPGLTGRVTSGGEPVAGARVRLYADQHHKTVSNGFAVFVDPDELEETISAADGSFRLTVRKNGAYYVRAERDGLAPALHGPVDVKSARGASGIELELGAGGAIEGRVIAAPGASTAGVIVGFSRGDACAFTQRVGADGSFRVERLMPGRWMVQRCDSEIVPGFGSSEWTSGRWDEIPGNCEVVAGRTTRFDLDLREQTSRYSLVGELQVDGEAPGVWTAWLFIGGPKDAVKASETVKLDTEGGFRIDASLGGKGGVLLECLAGRLEGCVLVADVEVGEGETRWSLDLLTARLELDGPSSALAPDERFMYRSEQGFPGVRESMRMLPLGDGPVAFDVPAGKGQLVLFNARTGPVATPAPLPQFDLKPAARVHCARP